MQFPLNCLCWNTAINVAWGAAESFGASGDSLLGPLDARLPVYWVQQAKANAGKTPTLTWQMGCSLFIEFEPIKSSAVAVLSYAWFMVYFPLNAKKPRC